MLDTIRKFVGQHADFDIAFGDRVHAEFDGGGVSYRSLVGTVDVDADSAVVNFRDPVPEFDGLFMGGKVKGPIYKLEITGDTLVATSRFGFKKRFKLVEME